MTHRDLLLVLLGFVFFFRASRHFVLDVVRAIASPLIAVLFFIAMRVR